MNRREILALGGASLAATLTTTLAGPARAVTLGQPQGPVILTVRGTGGGIVGSPNAGEVADFDLAMLDALPQQETVTETPWYDGPISFSGPLISDILAAAGAEGAGLRAFAVNDYAADIPMEDITTYPVILASRIGGELISVRDKGPLFVIYPFDRHPELVNELIFSRSVWQVKALEVTG
jgi:hypothetical protein